MKKILKYSLGEKNNFIPKLFYPSQKYLPEWYRREKKFDGGDPKIFGIRDANLTYKSCIPFFDSLTNGYMVELWTDIFVKKNESGIPIITWDVGPTPVYPRNPIESFIQPHEHNEHHFAWFNPYTIKTPSNYGLILGHPFNRFDLPFTTLTGITDADTLLTTGQVPFFIKNNFEGVIKAGTPMFQIIPFKRESWKHVEDKNLIKLNDEQLYLSGRILSGFYKKNLWKRRTFE